MRAKTLLLAAVAAGALMAGISSAEAAKLKIGFLPGVVDPFYQVMQLGVEAAAKDLGYDVVTQVPPTWGVEAQTPLLNAMVARGDINYIITAPVDQDQMVAPLKAAVDAGIKVITVDTFLGDGDYANGKVTFPISYIGSDNEEGGRISADGLAKAIGGKGTVYINSTNPNVSSVSGREKGFKEEMAAKYPDIKVLGPDYNLDDLNKAQQQTAAVLQQHPDLTGVFGTNVFSAQGTSRTDKGQVVACDSTNAAMDLRSKGTVSLVLAQKPFDMGYMAVEFAAADAAGVTSLPKRVETGFAILNKDNASDPAFSRFVYQVPGQ